MKPMTTELDLANFKQFVFEERSKKLKLLRVNANITNNVSSLL